MTSIVGVLSLTTQSVCLFRYARERENDTKKTTANQASRQSDLPVIPTEIKGAVPGTLVPDAEVKRLLTPIAYKQLLIEVVPCILG